MTTPEYYAYEERHDLWNKRRLTLHNSFFCLVEDTSGSFNWKPYFSIVETHVWVSWGVWTFAFSPTMGGQRK